MTLELGFNIINAPEDCDLLVLDEQGLLFEKEHAYVGKFSMPFADGRVDFELTESDIRSMSEESQRYLDNGNQCNLPTHHTDNVEANRGLATKWYNKVDSKGRLGLFSHTKFRDTEAAKLAKTEQTSIFAPGTTIDGTKKEYKRAVTHVALTGRPVIPGLDGFVPIAASLVIKPTVKGKTMLFKDLATSIGLQLSEDTLSDETKASKAIVASFKDITEQSDKRVAALALQLSEYKKLNPPKVDPIKISKAQVAMLRENRELKLSALVGKNILPCVAKSLSTIFCGEATLSLCLSEDKQDNFDEVIAALKDNDSIKLSEITGPQGGDYAKLLNTDNNPLMKVAQQYADAAAN